MKLTGQILCGAVVATLGALLAVAPAHAASYVPGTSIAVGADNNDWRWQNGEILSLYGPQNDDSLASNFLHTWDGTAATMYSANLQVSSSMLCENPADLTDVGGDKVLTCDPDPIDNGDGEVSIASEFRFFSDGQTVRMRYAITNTDAGTVSEQVLKIRLDAFQDPTTSVSYTDTDGVIGDYQEDYDTTTSVITDLDNYVWVTDDRAGEGVAVVKYAVGQAGSISPLVDIDNSHESGGQGAGFDHAEMYYRVPDLAPGETVEYIVLAKVYLFDDTVNNDIVMNGWQEATGTAIDAAVSETELESDAVVFADVSDRTRVVNWEPAPQTANENLANTGANSGASGLLAIGLVASLIALAVRRRRDEQPRFMGKSS